MAKRYSPKVKFQVVLELLQGTKTPGQVAKAYQVHPNTVNNWKQTLLSDGFVVVRHPDLQATLDIADRFGTDLLLEAG